LYRVPEENLIVRKRKEPCPSQKTTQRILGGNIDKGERGRGGEKGEISSVSRGTKTALSPRGGGEGRGEVGFRKENLGHLLHPLPNLPKVEGKQNKRKVERWPQHAGEGKAIFTFSVLTRIRLERRGVNLFGSPPETKSQKGGEIYAFQSENLARRAS